MNNLIYDTLKYEYIDSLLTLENICFEIPWTRQMFHNDISNKNAYYVLVICDDQVIAYGGMYKVLDEADITNIAVHPEFRNNGIAKNILEKIFSHCVKNSINKITLEVRKSNATAIGLYTHKGFEVVGERKKYYSNNNESAILMTKNL